MIGLPKNDWIFFNKFNFVFKNFNKEKLSLSNLIDSVSTVRLEIFTKKSSIFLIPNVFWLLNSSLSDLLNISFSFWNPSSVFTAQIVTGKQNQLN